jgi:hypothetical protein
MDDDVIWMIITFKSGQTLECVVMPEVLHLLSSDYAEFCRSGKPTGGWYNVRPKNLRDARLFVQFADLLHIA